MNKQTEPKWDPTEAITLSAIPLPRLVCWEGIISAEVLAGMPVDEFSEESTEIRVEIGAIQ